MKMGSTKIGINELAKDDKIAFNTNDILSDVSGDKVEGIQGSQDLNRVVLSIRRVARTVKGGKRLSFSAFAVVGDKNGKVGFALGKARDARNAIKKAIRKAESRLEPIKIWNTTIPHSVDAKFSASKVVLRPAPVGTGIITAKSIRAVADCAGIQNLKGKVLGSRNPISVVKATIKAMKSLRTKEEIYGILKS